MLGPLRTVAAAARAMADNNVGIVVVKDQGKLVGVVTDRDLAIAVAGYQLDPAQTALAEVMTRDPITIPVTAGEDEAVDLMRRGRVRRLLVVDHDLDAGRQTLAGIVTLDDLLINKTVSVEAARRVVLAQLLRPTRTKPAGFPHPVEYAPTDEELDRRHKLARRETLRRFAHRLQDRLGLEDPSGALEAFEVFTGALARRVSPSEASHLLAQLPALVQEHLSEATSGPDRSMTRAAIIRLMAQRLRLPQDHAAELVRKVAASLREFVSEGELVSLQSQLPPDLRSLLATGQDQAHALLH